MNSWPLRRALVVATCIATFVIAAGCGSGGGTKAPTVAPAATPPCSGASRVTPEQTEGPYFKAGSPARSSLIEPGMTGTRFTLTGAVLSAECRPVVGATLDFWQADDKGEYDNAGYRLRGHQSTDAAGHYRLETIIPGLYTGRTEHIHVKVQASGGPVITTQLYFAGVPENASDSIFDPALVMDVQQEGAIRAAGFDFVIAGR